MVAVAGSTPRLAAARFRRNAAGRRPFRYRAGRGRRLGRAAFAIRTADARQDLAPAIFYAEHGFPVSDIIAERWATLHRKAGGRTDGSRDISARRTRAASGRGVPQPRSGAVAPADRPRGREGFYEGPTADAILAAMREHGGTMTAPDLARLRRRMGDADRDVVPRLGCVRASAEHAGRGRAGDAEPHGAVSARQYAFHGAEALHVMIEAKKLAYADMLRYVGDPRFAEMPVPAMLDKGYARERARLIRPDRAATTAEPAVFDGVTNRSGGDTIYLSAIDRDGNIVSLIQSTYDGFGSGIVPSGTGFALHNRGALFTLDEHHPNASPPASGRSTRSFPVHAERRHADRIRDHGRLEPGAGPRTVRRERRRLRPGHPAGARGGRASRS